MREGVRCWGEVESFPLSKKNEKYMWNLTINGIARVHLRMSLRIKEV
jgi:hypothetical protein